MNLSRIVQRIKYPDRFNYAVSVVLSHEGGYSENKNDRGGRTNFGISQKFLDDNKLNYDVTLMTESLAKSIYKKYFWEKYSYNNFKNLFVATKVFDCGVNCGNYEAILILQRAINNVSNEKIIVDGILGEKTFNAANKCNDAKLLDNIRFEMRRFYLNLINEHPEFYEFKNGWLSRSDY